MDRFRLNIDVTDVSNVNDAVQVALQTISKHPNQEQGSRGIIGIRSGNKTYALVRNLISYTIKEQ